MAHSLGVRAHVVVVGLSATVVEMGYCEINGSFPVICTPRLGTDKPGGGSAQAWAELLWVPVD